MTARSGKRDLAVRPFASWSTAWLVLSMDPLLLHEPDRFKIHNEINQCGNQRFLLTAGAVALFGTVARYLLPSVTEPRFDEVITAACVSSGYSLILAALFYQSRQLRRVIRNLSTYLRAKGWSDWEADWYIKRRRGPHHQTPAPDLVAHRSVFAAMAVATLLCLPLPAFANAHLRGEQSRWQPWGWIMIGVAAVLALAVLVYVVSVATQDSSAQEDEMFAEWKQVLDGKPDAGTSDS